MVNRSWNWNWNWNWRCRRQRLSLPVIVVVVVVAGFLLLLLSLCAFIVVVVVWRCAIISRLGCCIHASCFVLLLLYLLVGFFRLCAWHRAHSLSLSLVLLRIKCAIFILTYTLCGSSMWHVTQRVGRAAYCVGAACAMHLKHLITCHISTHCTIEIRLCCQGLYELVIGPNKAHGNGGKTKKHFSVTKKPIGITKSFCLLCCAS